MIEIEFEKPTESVCACCGNANVHLTRFVYRDGVVYAVYYAAYTAKHEEKRLHGLIGLGDWDDGAKPEDRLAFAFQIWVDVNDFRVGLVDAKDSAWAQVAFLGRILDREEALGHEWKNDVFHITDHMLTDDLEITNYFQASGV